MHLFSGANMNRFFAAIFFAAIALGVVAPSAWAQYRADPEKVLAEEFGWTIQDLTKLSANKGFFSRNEPYQGFNCLEKARYLPKTDQEKMNWKVGTFVCRTIDRQQGEDVSAYMTLHWVNQSVVNPLGRQYVLDRISESMSGSRAAEGFSNKIVETREVEKIKVHLIEHQLPWSSSPFYGALLEFTHKDVLYFLSLQNALNAPKINKKPWDLAPDVARRITFLE